MTSRIPESVYDRIHDRVGVTPFFSRNSLFRDQDIALGITGLIINLNAVDNSVTELVRASTFSNSNSRQRIIHFVWDLEFKEGQTPGRSI